MSHRMAPGGGNGVKPSLLVNPALRVVDAPQDVKPQDVKPQDVKPQDVSAPPAHQ
jgi:hypothetical protein